MGKESQEAVAGQLVAHRLAVSLTVKDLQESLRWYTEVLGFSIDRRIEREGKLRGIGLKAGDVHISIN